MDVQSSFVVLRTVTEIQKDVRMTSQLSISGLFPCLVIILPKYTINLMRIWNLLLVLRENQIEEHRKSVYKYFH